MTHAGAGVGDQPRTSSAQAATSSSAKRRRDPPLRMSGSQPPSPSRAERPALLELRTASGILRPPVGVRRICLRGSSTSGRERRCAAARGRERGVERSAKRGSVHTAQRPQRRGVGVVELVLQRSIRQRPSAP